MNENEKRYRKQMLLGAAVYMAVTLASVLTLKHSGLESVGLRTLVALAPMVLVIWVGNNVMKFVRTLDEMQQRIQIEAVVFAAVVTGLLTGAYGFMEGAGYPELNTHWILPMLSVLWVIGTVRARRRYQ